MKSTKMNILMISIAFPTSWDHVNGFLLKEIARTMAKKHNVMVLHCTTIPKNSHVKPGIIEEEYDGLPVVRVFLKNTLLPNMVATTFGFFKGLNYLKKKKVRIDIVHAQWFQSAIPFLFKMRQTPVVLEEGWSGFPLKQLTPLSTFIAKKTMSHCKFVMSPSHYLISKILSYGIEANFLTVPSIVDTDYFFLRKKIKKDIVRPLIVARQDPVKGIPILLKAIKEVSKVRTNFHLDIVGGGPHLKEYVDLAKQLGIENFVSFHGEKSKADVAKFMQNCDFFILSSHTENLSGVISEALCCGKPTIATKVGALPELFDMIKIPMGKLVDLNPAALKDGILYMIDNFTIYDEFELAKRGKELFSADTWAKKYEEIYYQAIKC